MAANIRTSFLICLAVPFLAAAGVSQSGPTPNDPAAAGAGLYQSSGCAHCHGAQGEGTKKGPSLQGIERDKNWPAEKMRDQILNGGEKMPPFSDSLTDDEISQIIVYLRAKDRTASPHSAEPK